MDNGMKDSAQKEGLVERDSLGAIQEAPVQDDKSSESSPETTGNTAGSGVEESSGTEQGADASKQARDRFEDNPGFKSLRNQFKETRRQLDEYRNDMKQARLREERYLRQLDALQQANGPKKTELPPDQVQARDQLAELLRESPVLKPLFEKLDQVEQFNNSLTEREMTTKYAEVEKSMEKICADNGLDIETELQACDSWLDQHPVFSKLYPAGKTQFPPELYELAFKAINHDRADELADKRANLKSIKERERLRSANSETPAANSSGGRPMPKKLEDFLSERMKDGIIAR